MYKFFTSKFISIISIVISLFALALSIAFIIEDGIYFDSDGIATLVLLFFGLIAFTQKIKSQIIPLSNYLKFWILLILNLILQVWAISLFLDEEEILALLIFSPLWIVIIHYYYLSKVPSINVPPKNSLIFNKISISLKSINYFKLFIVIAIIFYLCIQHEKSKNGRFESYDNESRIIDTRTGFVYEVEMDWDESVPLYRPQLPE